MKVIDLLNKIAKGEKFDNCKIKFKGIEPEEISEYFLFDRLYEEDLNLNDEVEIIEEEKRIEKIKIDEKDRIQALSTGNYVYKVNQPTKNIIYKINELVEEINKLRSKK